MNLKRDIYSLKDNNIISFIENLIIMITIYIPISRPYRTDNLLHIRFWFLNKRLEQYEVLS